MWSFPLTLLQQRRPGYHRRWEVDNLSVYGFGNGSYWWIAIEWLTPECSSYNIRTATFSLCYILSLLHSLFATFSLCNIFSLQHSLCSILFLQNLLFPLILAFLSISDWRATRVAQSTEADESRSYDSGFDARRRRKVDPNSLHSSRTGTLELESHMDMMTDWNCWISGRYFIHKQTSFAADCDWSIKFIRWMLGLSPELTELFEYQSSS